MKIEVTAEDIDNGIRTHFLQCPIALAIQRATRDPGWYVSARGTVINNKNAAEEIKLPKKCAQFVTRFDDDKSVKPFSFEFKGA